MEKTEYKLTMPKWVSIVVALADRELYTSEIAKGLDITYSHVCKVLYSLEKDGYVTHNSIGRNKYHQLTDKGESLAAGLIEVNTILGLLKVE